MVKSACLGYPRFGIKRELKRALEKFWRLKIDKSELERTAAQIRCYNWQLMADAGIDHIPSNDFSLYDQVLDTSMMVGAIPERYRSLEEEPGLETYFAMARGCQHDGVDLPAMEMTKWFDTNYHYLVPEFEPEQEFKLCSNKPIKEIKEALGLGIETRPVLLGPVSFLLLGKSTIESFTPLTLLDDLLPVYQTVLSQLAGAGAAWVQIDEPYLCLDLDEPAQEAFRRAYQILSVGTTPNLMLTTYFGGLAENRDLALELPVDGLHLDLVRAPEQLPEVLSLLKPDQVLSLGVVDGRNVWRTNLDRALGMVTEAVGALGSNRVLVAPSCSLQFCPYDLDLETALDDELRSWLSFAKQKVEEVEVLKCATNGMDVAVKFDENRQVVAGREKSPRTHNAEVRKRIAEITPEMYQRDQPFDQRRQLQAAKLNLPLFPTTTIGSFPQTREVRKHRAEYLKGSLTLEEYNAFLRDEIKRTIQIQEEIGLDVLVHGEYERSDMVEYFGQQLTGFCFTKHGWVQSYGSRGVRPPIIYGDVARTEPMTVAWSRYAQFLTEKPMKGMLTGPITILQWSFVRDDQPLSDTCRQIALAMRDEVLDLEANDIRIIQIDEPAFREGLPLRRSDWEAYLEWAVNCFRLASAGVRDETQIHTHMCYAEFNDIIEAIAAMDADVISIEASRSKMELLSAFKEIDYPSDIGPGVYDIHSPRVPTQDEIESLIQKALKVLTPEQLWINPDCGLKTRDWDEVLLSLKAMVLAAKALRKAYQL